MINFILALLAGTAATVLFSFLLGGGDFEIWYGILPGLIALSVAYFLLARKSLKELEAVFMRAQEELKLQKIDPAIEILKEGYPIGKKQFLIAPQVDGQIGSILYMARRFDESEPYLQRSFNRNWIPRAMLGALHYKRKNTADMKAVFEDAVKHNKKQALLWNLYAYCLWKSNERDAAIAVLNRALAAIPGEEKTQANLTALQNDKNMKMRGWDLMWYQFHLEKPPVQQQPQHQHQRAPFPMRRR